MPSSGTNSYEKDIGVPIEAIQSVDAEVHNKLPPGTQITSISPHSKSYWTRTARIDTTRDGINERYFLKACAGERGRKMVLGEFMAMSEIHRHNPSFVPQPLARGTYDSLDGVHFLLCEFRDMDSSKLPDLERFPALVADMHRTITSRDGRFGFGCTTYHGNVPIEHGWSDSWEEYFIRTTRVLIDMEQEARGRNAEILDLAGPLFEEVVPRLLRPLETGSEPIRPSLIHGDLWNGNTATDKKTSEPIIFDAAGFYAHNEYELAVWRQPWNEIGAPYRARYCRHFPPAEPADEFDDRGELYSVRVNLLDSILYKDDENYRHTVVSTMRELVAKFSK